MRGASVSEWTSPDAQTISRSKILLATLAAGTLMQGVTALLWMNPLTTRIILTPEFGQSAKLINVWTVWEPLPRITQQPSMPMLAGFLLFTLLHVLAYVRLHPVLPGDTCPNLRLSRGERGNPVPHPH